MKQSHRDGHNTLGRLQGLIEAWGWDWTPQQEARIFELYNILSTSFVLWIFSSGFQGDVDFLSKIEDSLHME